MRKRFFSILFIGCLSLTCLPWKVIPFSAAEESGYLEDDHLEANQGFAYQEVLERLEKGIARGTGYDGEGFNELNRAFFERILEENKGDCSKWRSFSKYFLAWLGFLPGSTVTTMSQRAVGRRPLGSGPVILSFFAFFPSLAYKVASKYIEEPSQYREGLKNFICHWPAHKLMLSSKLKEVHSVFDSIYEEYRIIKDKEAFLKSVSDDMFGILSKGRSKSFFKECLKGPALAGLVTFILAFGIRKLAPLRTQKSLIIDPVFCIERFASVPVLAVEELVLTPAESIFRKIFARFSRASEDASDDDSDDDGDNSDDYV